MSQGWHLGGRWYVPLEDLGLRSGDCSWHVLRDEAEGSRWVLQRWSPRPPDRDLDRLRETYLQRFTEADPADPVAGRFGFDPTQCWFLQRLQEPSLAEAWPLWSLPLRQSFLRALERRLQRDLHPRLLHPAAIALRKGRILVPRVIGEPPVAWSGFPELLPQTPGDEGGPGPWELAPDLSDRIAQPVRGRGQELTYLKSLMFGLSTPAPMERIVVLQGEGGLGLARLGRWAAAAAETEGIWVGSYEVQHGERAGAFLARVLQGLLGGFEADFYARSPETARILAARLPTFAFLRGGRRAADDAPLDPVEIAASLKLLSFIADLHPRMIQVHHLERADRELQTVLGELVVGSRVAWFFTMALHVPGGQARSFLAPLRDHPSVAIVHLNRLEDHDLLDLMDDLLGPNRLPSEFRGEVCQASLGNPGLLHGILENAQMEGSLVWSLEEGWHLDGSRPAHVRIHEDLAQMVLSGRMQRLEFAPTAVLRFLALVEEPLPLDILGRALGIAGDPLDEALRLAASAKLAEVKDGQARLSSPKVRELVVASMPEQEQRRLARALLKALGTGASPALTLRLESLASDPAVVLERLLRMTEQDVPPVEAEQVLQQGLRLNPSPAQEARLWECLADAWTLATTRGRLPAGGTAGRAPCDLALEALARARSVLGAPEGGGDDGQQIRLLRKEAFLQLRARNLPKAAAALEGAAGCLAGQPRHPEQSQLRLALGQLHLLQGYSMKGIRALEEGLNLITAAGPSGSHHDQVALLLELGKAQAERCQFQRGLATLRAAQRLMEHGQDYRRLAMILAALARIYLALGQPDAAYGHLREALQAARIQDDLELQGWCHLEIGILKSRQQALASALTHLESALDRFATLHDRVAMAAAKLWKARTLAALGDTGQCELLLLQALDIPDAQLSVAERGEQLFLQAEIAGFRGGWRDAAMLYRKATQVFEGAGLLWNERLARLRHLQSLAQTAGSLDSLGPVWSALEHCKAQIEGSGSRWLDLEWHKAHALLLATLAGAEETIAQDSITALGAMLGAAREMRFPAEVLEATALGAAQLQRRGESLGARAWLQGAFSSLQELWSRVPEGTEYAFLGRPDIHRFKAAVEAAGLPFVLPERVDALEDWTPTQITLPVFSPF